MSELFEDITYLRPPKRSKTLTVETYRYMGETGLSGGMTSVGKWSEALTESGGQVFTVRSREIGDRTFVVVSRDDGDGIKEAFGSAPTEIAKPLVSRLIDSF